MKKREQNPLDRLTPNVLKLYRRLSPREQKAARSMQRDIDSLYREWCKILKELNTVFKSMRPKNEIEQMLYDKLRADCFSKLSNGVSAIQNEAIAQMMPHAIRGASTLISASQGGRDKARQVSEPKRTECLAALAEYRRKNPGVSLTAARERIGARYRVSRRTLERYAKNLSTK